MFLTAYLLHQNHVYSDILATLFGKLSQNCLKCYALGYSPNFAPHKTWLTTLTLCIFLIDKSSLFDGLLLSVGEISVPREPETRTMVHLSQSNILPWGCWDGSSVADLPCYISQAALEESWSEKAWALELFVFHSVVGVGQEEESPRFDLSAALAWNGSSVIQSSWGMRNLGDLPLLGGYCMPWLELSRREPIFLDLPLLSSASITLSWAVAQRP